MEENNDEKVAQLLYENVKLQDELKLLKRHALSLEENYNLLILNSSQRDNHIKSLEQQINWMCESLREKERVIEALELDNEKFINSNKKLILEHSSLKKELIEEQERFNIKEEETRNAYDKLKKENAKLLSEISNRSEELFHSNSTVSNLEQKIKELENENLELLILKDNLLHRISEEQSKKVDETKNSKSHDWVTDKSETSIFDHDVPFAKRCQSLNLRDEILQVEVEEKEVLISELKNLLLKKEEEISRFNQLVMELKEKLESAGLLIEDGKFEFYFHSSPLNDVYKHLLKLINWPEGQSGEIKPLTEVPSLAIVVKDGVETSQPGSIWVVETITIASQTDPIKNLSPVLGFKSSEKCHSTETNSLSDSDEEVRPRSASLLEETEAEKNRPIFSDHRNSDLDMDIFRMHQRKKKIGSAIERPNEEFLSFFASKIPNENSNESKFVNLNFLGSGDGGNSTGSGNSCETCAENNPKNNLFSTDAKAAIDDENEINNPEERVEPPISPVTEDSNIRPESIRHKIVDSRVFSHTSDEDLETEFSDAENFYSLTKSFLKNNVSLSEEEARRKFEDLSFAFKTDLMTIRKRFHLLKRKRDQAEINIKSELKAIKMKLKNIPERSGIDVDHLDMMADLNKQLDFVLNAAMQLTSSSEAYGYVQHEERTLEFVSVMVQHVENVVGRKKEKSQKAVPFETEGNSAESTPNRTVTVVALENSSRRRASIAALPRIGKWISNENGSQGKGIPWINPCRFPMRAIKKLSFSQPSHFVRNVNNNIVEENESRKELVDGSRKSVEDHLKKAEDHSESPSLTTASDAESNFFEGELSQDGNENENFDLSNNQLKEISDSADKLWRMTTSEEYANAFYCLRKIFEWTKLMLSETRFRWPENIFHYLPFYLTWYVVFLLTLVFLGGFFTGINGCFIYLNWQHSILWFGIITFVVLARRFYRFLMVLLLASVCSLIPLALWLRKLRGFTSDEVDRFFRSLGIALEVRYLDGSPPV